MMKRTRRNSHVVRLMDGHVGGEDHLQLDEEIWAEAMGGLLVCFWRRGQGLV